MVLVPVAVVGAYLAGIQWKHALALLLMAAMMLPVGWHFLKPYQKERVHTFLRPEDDPKGSGYQILQSKIAVGSGGFWGKGLGHGSQNQVGFVPVRYSDFILAAMAEEIGFVGVLAGAAVVYGFAAAADSERPESEGPRGDVSGDGRGGDTGVSRAGECGHGDRLHAGNWNSAAADELRRIGHFVCIFGVGPGDERTHPALRQLKWNLTICNPSEPAPRCR